MLNCLKYNESAHFNVYFNVFGGEFFGVERKKMVVEVRVRSKPFQGSDSFLFWILSGDDLRAGALLVDPFR